MFHLSDVRLLSDFERRQTELLQHLKITRRPLLLTPNSRAEVVIQDAESYQKLLEQLGGASGEAARQPRSSRRRQPKAQEKR